MIKMSLLKHEQKMKTSFLRSLSRFVLVILSTFALSGCVTLRSNITTFHGENHVERGTIRVLPINDEQKNSLEFLSVKNRLIEKLISQGYVAVSEQDNSQFTAFITYGVDSGKVVTSAIPIYGQTGGGTSYTTGNVYSNTGRSLNYNSTTTTMPTYGMVGAVPVSGREFTREMNIDIYNSTTQKKMDENRVKSLGSCGNINAVIPGMLDATFKKFPGISGQPQRVDVEITGVKC